MSVSSEVSELRVKVAELENDLWHMRSQKDAAVASTQTLIQVISNLTNPSNHETSARPQPSTETDVVQLSELDQLKFRNEEAQKTIKQLQEQLATSEKFRKNLQAVARNLASKKDHPAHPGDLSEDEGSFADDESRSSHASDRQAKRTRKSGTNGADHSLSLPAVSAPVAESVSTHVPSAAPEKPSQTTSLTAEQKAAKKAEDARVMKLKLEKLKLEKIQQLKRAQSATSGIFDKFGKTPLVRTPVISAVPEKPVAAISTIPQEPCLGTLMKGHPFEETEPSNPTGTDSVVLQGKRKRDDTLTSNDYSLRYDESRSSQLIDLNYDDDEEYRSSEYSDDEYVYKNEEEIDLGLSEEDSEDDSDVHDSMFISVPSEQQRPVVLVPTPYKPLPPHLKAIDDPICEWENSDDDAPITRADGPPEKSVPKALEQIELDKIKDPKLAKLLGPWEPPEEVEIELLPFRIPEEPTVYKVPLKSASDEKIEDEQSQTLARGTNAEEFSLKAPRNREMWASGEERFLALSEHLARDRYHPGFFKYGLFYIPDPAKMQEDDVFRTVHLTNLPDETTIGDLMSRVRGGMVVSAHILDTKKLLGSKSAQVVFMSAGSAAEYVAFAEEHPISFGKNIATVTLIGTPTYPMRSGLAISIKRFGHTRCLEIPGYPDDRIPGRALILDLTTKQTFTSALPDGFRAAAMEEPYYDDETGVLHLAFGSVELATSAFHILRNTHAYRQQNVNPVFVEDPCAGDLEELLDLPPMASELAVEGGEKTHLQLIQDSFKPRKDSKEASRNPTTMPAVPSFHFQLPTGR